MRRRWVRAAAVLLGSALLVAGLAQGRSPAPALPEAALAELPREAQTTLALVRRGGPFPFDRDGVVFGNYEGRLPQRERGHYREYTVPTPGLKHRGARRIVAGCGVARGEKPPVRLEAPCPTGEIYYTDDHYQSFRRIRE